MNCMPLAVMPAEVEPNSVPTQSPSFDYLIYFVVLTLPMRTAFVGVFEASHTSNTYHFHRQLKTRNTRKLTPIALAESKEKSISVPK